MRLDGRAFHTFTRGMEKPFDEAFHRRMVQVATALMGDIQGAQLAYIQSDEISILIVDYKKLTSEGWFDYNIQKMTSVSASLAGGHMSLMFKRPVQFDSRVFNIPKEEVCNYFIWRQKDWERNSLTMLAQAHFSHAELMNKGKSAKHEMLYEKGINWADLDSWKKNGSCVFRRPIAEAELKDSEQATIEVGAAPIFTEDRSFIEKHVEPEEV